MRTELYPANYHKEFAKNNDEINDLLIAQMRPSEIPIGGAAGPQNRLAYSKVIYRKALAGKFRPKAPFFSEGKKSF
jgi:hypothetical protein